MNSKTRESEQTRPLFDSAVKYIGNTLEAGLVNKEDKELLTLALTAFNGHIKVLNSERASDALRFNVSQALAENIEGLRSSVRQQLPDYVSTPKKV